MAKTTVAEVDKKLAVMEQQLIDHVTACEKTSEETIQADQARKMSFEELIQANQWTESDIEKNLKHQLSMCYGFLAFAGVLFILAIVLFILGNLFGGAFTILFMCLGVAYAYQSWVSSEQLKQRKIRINVRESLRALLHSITKH